MNTIKNLHLINLPSDKLAKLDAGASLHEKMSNITFKILEVTEKAITVSVSQGKHLSENYANEKTLINRTHELFDRFFVDAKIQVRAIPYTPNPITEIDAAWVKANMDKLNIRVTDMVNETGIDKTNLSAWATGARPMSQPVKAMFHYYFSFKKASSSRK
jgi:hypothetical protein